MTEEVLELISNLKKKNEELERQNSDLRETRGSLEKEVAYLREQLKALALRLYGRRSERLENPDQTDLFDKLLQMGEISRAPVSETYQSIEYTRRKPSDHGPKPLPEDFPRDRVEIDPPESERTCACCQRPMDRVDEKVTEELAPR